MGGFYPFAGSSGAGLLLPSGNPNGIADTANIQAAAKTGQRLAIGTFYVSNLTVDTMQAIIGSGPGTILQAISGVSGYLVSLANPASTYLATVKHLTLLPGNGAGGVNLDNTGFTGGGGIFDSRHTLDDVHVISAGGISIRLGAAIRSARVTRCMPYYGQAGGMLFDSGATDNYISGCIVGQSAGHNYQFNDGNNWFIGNKGFYAGYNNRLGTWGTTQAGLYLNACHRNSIIGCAFQQSALNGIDGTGIDQNAIIGCVTDTNSAGASVTTGVGINTNAFTNSAVIGNVGDNNSFISPGSQQFGLAVAGTQTGTALYANPVTGSSGHFNYVSGSGYQLVSPGQADFGSTPFVKIPGVVLAPDGVQALVNGSTIPTATDGNFAAVPVTAAGAVTGLILQVPGNTWQVVKVVNQSAFTLTFAAAGTSNVADGVANVIPALTARTFTFDANTSLWYRDA